MSPRRVYDEEKRAAEFWSRVDKSSGEDSCWLWTGTRVPKGYGMTSWKGKQKFSHRLAWELTNGPIPDGLIVLHSCDHPPCCNPKHLSLGTREDNMRDMEDKSRYTRTQIGEKWFNLPTLEYTQARQKEREAAIAFLREMHTEDINDLARFIARETVIAFFRELYPGGEQIMPYYAAREAVKAFFHMYYTSGKIAPANYAALKTVMTFFRELYTSGNATRLTLTDEFQLSRREIDEILDGLEP